MIPRSSKTRCPMIADGKQMSTNNARRLTIAKSWTYAPAWRAGQLCLIPVESWVEPYLLGPGLTQRVVVVPAHGRRACRSGRALQRMDGP